MGHWPINPVTFDGKKFAVRYGLKGGINPDFYAAVVNGVTHVFLKDGITIPDNPPIFDTLDPPGPTITQLISSDTTLSANLKTVLLRLARGR